MFYNSKNCLVLVALCTMSLSWAERSENKKFSKEEYEHYMKLISELDPEVHATLRQCEIDLKGPCIDQARAEALDKVDFGSKETKGYPIMVIKPLVQFPEHVQKQLIGFPVQMYKSAMQFMVPAMTTAERQKLLQGLKAVDPDAYSAITHVDPSGERHIQRSYDGGTWTIPSFDDGLPLFYFDPSVVNGPYNEMLCTIAHELAHYVLGHFYEMYTLSHRQFAQGEAGVPRTFRKGKKFVGQLPFKETFDNARSRIKEHEADRMVVMEFGLPIDDAIAQAERFFVKAKEMYLRMPREETFKTTHPLWADRIKHFESLRSEVELYKAQKKQHKSVDYEALAREYLKKYQQKYGIK